MRVPNVAVLCLGVAVFGAACAPPRSPKPPARGEPTLSVLSYNVNFGMPGDAETLEAIRSANADLVLLQETTESWEAALRGELAALYPHMSFRHCCRAGGLGVLSKTKFSEHEYFAAPRAWFPAWRLVVETRLGPVQVLNVHLRPQISDSGSVVSGYFTTPPVREREIAAYAATLERGLPTLVVGDFNENDSGRAVNYLKGRGFRSALPEFDPGADTWRWQTSLGEVNAQLDHIVYDPALDPVNVSVIEAGSSDHYPVLASFRRDDTPKEPARVSCTGSLCLGS
ncbi:MAG TPA: endonuclease/exonuclease/phosphatase family protein [Polyangiaceae bacterium]|nr:endonuclease/exonuclease/phosphatase family protein [Polyangiaceae bacterium]